MLRDVGEIFDEEMKDGVRCVVNDVIAENIERVIVIHQHTRLVKKDPKKRQDAVVLDGKLC
jgi:hypothetical protein